MPEKLNGLILAFGVALAVLFTSCPSQLWNADAPPYAISKPVYRNAGPDDTCTIGGVFFDFYNKSEKEIVFIETCMNVYNSKSGELAFSGAGGLTSGAECIVQKLQKKNLCIPLDEYLWQIENTSLCTDNFFIKKIIYADGTIWQDKLGVYSNSWDQEA